MKHLGGGRAPRSQRRAVRGPGWRRALRSWSPPPRTGSPTQNPMPLNTATNAGASAVPRPSSALSTRTDLSSASGFSAAVSVFSDAGK